MFTKTSLLKSVFSNKRIKEEVSWKLHCVKGEKTYEEIGEKYIADNEFLLSTRIDNDDMLSLDFVQTLQSHVKYISDKAIITFPNGIQWFERESITCGISYPPNHFLNFLEHFCTKSAIFLLLPDKRNQHKYIAYRLGKHQHSQDRKQRGEYRDRNIKHKRQKKTKNMRKYNMKGKRISSRGITLVGLLISIIILLIVATISINFFINEKILDSAIKGTEEHFYSEIKEQVKLAYNEWKINKETENRLQLKDIVEDKLNKSYGTDNVNVIERGHCILVKVIKAGKEYEYTLINDGNILDGQLVCLDITDGNIDLYENGYKQYKESLQEINKNNIIN